MAEIRVWQVTPDRTTQIQMRDQSTLDSITRQLPDGYYSTFRTFDGCTRVLGLHAHLQRLYEPVAEPDVDEDALRRQLRALLEPYRSGEARVRLVMAQVGQAYIAMELLKPLPRQVYENGVRVETTELHRQQPRLKSTSFIGRSDSERKHIAREGIFEALLVNDGKILEGMTSNFFYVGRDASRIPPYIGTARDDILPGVTRKTVLEIARGRGLEIRYGALQRDQVETVAEAFITSSSRGIVPVIQIDHVTVGQGSPGAITRELMAAYEAYVLEHAETI